MPLGLHYGALPQMDYQNQILGGALQYGISSYPTLTQLDSGLGNMTAGRWNLPPLMTALFSYVEQNGQEHHPASREEGRESHLVVLPRGLKEQSSGSNSPLL